MPINTNDIAIDPILNRAREVGSQLDRATDILNSSDLRNTASSVINGIQNAPGVEQLSSIAGQLSSSLPTGQVLGSISNIGNNLFSQGQELLGSVGDQVNAFGENLSRFSNEAQDIVNEITGDENIQLASPSTEAQLDTPPSRTVSAASFSPRPYFPINPKDTRYDFLTGNKIVEGSPITSSGNFTGANINPIQSGGGNSPSASSPREETFTNAFGDTYTQEDIDSVENLKSFNEDVGGGAAQARLTDGERAYAIEQGYISSSSSSVDPDAGDPRDF